MTRMGHGFQQVTGEEVHIEGVKEIVLAGDIGCTSFTEESRKIISEILKIPSDVFVILGDIGFMDTDGEFKEVIDFCNRKTGMPIFTLCGNHDIVNFQRFFSRAAYAIVLDKTAFVLLDNATMMFSYESLSLLRETLARHRGKRFFIAFHVPPPTNLDEGCMEREEWEKVKNILDPYKVSIECIFSGHIHGFQEYTLDGYRVFISGGGGAVLYNLEKDVLKSHHAIKIFLRDNGDIDIEVKPVHRE